VTNVAGDRRTRKDRRRERSLPPEHDFSIAAIGIAVVCVVIGVMFSV
jgi:hypothetical protein